ncbi:MAG TPA: hypothetical protein VEM13_04410 [Gemmatimonadales bacterium]|nr:hypothetical protein [Gemmatimonadales bacterium]
MAALAALSTPLAAQSTGAAGAWTLGFAGTLGGGWQVEALDVGYARALHAGPLSVAALTARLGSFVDENAIIGGTRGFVFGVTLATRTPMAHLADLGSDSSTNRLGLDVTLEATGYAGAHTPLPVGSPWGAVSLLPGLRFGDPNGAQYGLVFGPTVFLGQSTQVRAFLGLRFEAPLARGERHP